MHFCTISHDIPYSAIPFDGNGNSTEAMRYGLIAAAFILLRFIFQAISVSLTHYGAYSALYAVRQKIVSILGKLILAFLLITVPAR